MPPLSRLQQRMRPMPTWNCSTTSSFDSSESSSSHCSNSDKTSHSRQSCVGFGSIEIREYNRELGMYDDIPSSLSLGWEYTQQAQIPVDRHEEEKRITDREPKTKRKTTASKKWPNFSSKETSACVLPLGAMPTTTKQRKRILKEFGYSKREIERNQVDRPRDIGYAGSNTTSELPAVLKLVLKLC